MAVIARDQITLTDMTDIELTRPYYILVSNTAAAPSKPETYPPPTGWVTSEPSYDSSKTAYMSWYTEYSNGLFEYSDVSKVSSYEAAKEAWNKANNALDTVNNAVAEEQYIYISKASGTSSVSGTTAWIAEAGDKQNTWSTKRPTYDSSYPVLFVAKQKKVVSGTVTCTTPVKDDTNTVIDGGHITTGTIDASVATITNINATNIATGIIKDSANKNSWDLDTGALTIKNGNINITTSSDANDYIKLLNSSSDTYSSISSNKFTHSTTSSTKLASKSYDRAATNIGCFTQRMGSDLYQEYGLTVTGGAGNSSLYWGYPKLAVLTPGSVYVTTSNSDGTQSNSAMNSDGITTPKITIGTSAMADFIIDQGTSSVTNGNWYYRKWKQGRYECWLRKTIRLAVTTAWKDLYYAEIDAVTYPITFVGDYPVLQVTGQSENGNSWIVPNYTNYSFTSTGSVFVYSPASQSSVAVTLNYYAQGQWE